MTFKINAGVSTDNPMPVAQGVTEAIVLANALASLAAGATTTPVTGVPKDSYGWAVVMTGAGPLLLEYLGPDGTSWLLVETISATGSKGVGVSANATLRLRNSGGAAITNLSSSIG